MKRYIPGFFAPIWGSPALIFLTALFVCGAAAGSFTGLLAASNGSEQIVQLADALAVQAGRAPNGMDAVFAALGAFGWQVSVLLAGWMRPSSLLLSLVCTVRGFTLSFSVSTLLRALGMDGIWRSLAASGMAAVSRRRRAHRAGSGAGISTRLGGTAARCSAARLLPCGRQ